MRVEKRFELVRVLQKSLNAYYTSLENLTEIYERTYPQDVKGSSLLNFICYSGPATDDDISKAIEHVKHQR